MTTVRALATVVLLAVLAAVPRGQGLSIEAGRYDQLLDLYVRDGLVYYQAIKSTRGPLDEFVGSLAAARVDAAPRDEQVAFWLNAYNAIVLKTVIDNYPIKGTAPNYPSNSIRQIANAFERPQRVAGRSVSLDQIEQTILPAYHDARVFLALGRGALGSGRLRSEAFVAARLDQQLAVESTECISRASCLQVARDENTLKVSTVFAWRRDEFIESFASKAPAVFRTRSPIERAIVAFVEPQLLPVEQEFLRRNQFKLEYLPFDWTLNDLTGR